MPVTQGHGNPDWTKEETILALDLLYTHGKPVGKSHPDVEALSALLRSARFHSKESRTERFRNADGVAMKLLNLFSAEEPGRGLSFSKTDGETVSDFPRSRAKELSAIAAALRASIDDPTVEHEALPEEETFVEGRWLTARHRQRDARLRKRLLASRHGKLLVCEICEYEPVQSDRKMAEALFEAHHRVPLSAAEGVRSTTIKDMALLCARCHRFIHYLISEKRSWVTTEQARTVYAAMQVRNV